MSASHPPALPGRRDENATLFERHRLTNADQDAIEIGDLYRKGRSSMVDSVKYLADVGRQLTKKKDKVGHGRWMAWLEANAEVLGFGVNAAGRLMKLGREFCVDAEFDESEALRLNRIAWGNNVRGTAGTGENEWFTPEEYLVLVRDVLGTIDLDPASHEEAQKLVQAERYYTKDDDGLQHEWHGRVFLNPPYAQPLIAQFVGKMCAERRAGRVASGIMLTRNYTDTTWFREAISIADAICFTSGRIRFQQLDGELASPTQGQAFFYFGNDVERFLSGFAEIGWLCVPRSRPRRFAATDLTNAGKMNVQSEKVPESRIVPAKSESTTESPRRLANVGGPAAEVPLSAPVPKQQEVPLEDDLSIPDFLRRASS
jgi:phage N-6-adenine-methyltransferase